MPRNRVQHQKGLSDDAFERLYPDEEACRKAWFAWRWPEGFKCPRCAATEYCEIRERQLLQCRQLPLSDIADRRHRPAGHQAADAGVVPRHASARPGQERAVQHRAGPAAGDLDQCRLAGSAQADAGDDRAGSPLQAWRRRAADRDRRRLYRRRAHRRRLPGVAGAATRPLSLRSRPPRTDGHCTPACKSCAGSRPAKPSGYAPVSRPEPPSSATAASGFAALPSSRASSTSAISPAPIAPPRATPPSAGRTPMLANVKNSLLATHRAVDGQTSAALPRRLRLALQPPLCPENNPRAPRHRRNGDPANALSPPQTG